MASSRRTRRRRQQRSSRRHRFKLESLEKRYALDGSQASTDILLLSLSERVNSEYTVNIDDDQDLVSQEIEQQLDASANYVMNLIQNNISWEGTLDAEIQVRRHDEYLGEGDPDGIMPSIVSLSWDDEANAYSNDAIYEMRTGSDRQPSKADVGCTIYLSQSGEIKNYGMPVWFDSSPTRFNYEVPVNPPTDHFDFIGVFTHEVFHGLGFSRDSHEFRDLTVSSGDIDYFDGPKTREVNGGRLPLRSTASDTPDDHYGNDNHPEITSGLMYQYGHYERNRLDIGIVDLAVLEDVGLQVHSTIGLPKFDILDSEKSTVLADPPLATYYRSVSNNTVGMSWSPPESLGVRDGVDQTIQGYQILYSMDGGNSTDRSWQESDLIPASVNKVIINEPEVGLGWPVEYKIVALTESGRGFVGTPVLQENNPPTMDELENPVWYGDEFHDQQVTFTVEGISAGINEYFQPLRVHATSSKPALVASLDYEWLGDVLVFPPPSTKAIAVSYTVKAGQSGLSIITLTVEDGGADEDLETAGDNTFTSRESDVTVLLVISGEPSITTEVNKAVPGDLVLARDVDNNIFVDGQPVIYNQQQVPQAIFGSSVVSADTSDSENALLLQPLGADAEDPPTHRLLTDETWRINGIFNSLQNASSPVLDLSGREVSVPLSIAAVAGAYEINGANNPTLVMRRGQTYTFNLNTAGHPFWLQTTGGGYQSANVYSNGFTGNSQTTGEHQWVVSEDAPEEIFYQCEFHPEMFGKIIVVD